MQGGLAGIAVPSLGFLIMNAWVWECNNGFESKNSCFSGH